MKNETLTYYVLQPRDELCKTVNPKLWDEFCRVNPHIKEPNLVYTEAFCVQWLDNYYDLTAQILQS